MDDFSVLPLQIYYWAGLPIEEDSSFNFQNVAAGGIIVLLIGSVCF
jgi:ABC-type phosphate transport system permease subunit